MQEVFINQGLSVLSQILSDKKIQKIMLVIGNNGYSSVKNLIEPYIKGFNTQFFIIDTSNFETIISGCETLTKFKADIIIAVGGGRIIDAAKLISTNALSLINYESVINGKKEIKSKHVPLLVMPTTAGSGSEATCFSVVYLKNQKYSVVSEHMLPNYVIIDYSLVKGMPVYLKACCLFDAFSQAIESFWSIGSTKSSKLNAIQSMSIIHNNFFNYIEKDFKGIEHIVYASHLSGLAINESKTTLPHALSYFLTINYGIPHGHAVALTLGFIGKINVKLGDFYLKRTMSEIFKILKIEENNFEKYWYNLMQKSGLEVRLSKLGINKGDLNLIVDSVNIQRLKNHPIKISKKIIINELRKIY